MRVGSIIRGDNSGLGTLAREFWDNGIINKALIYPNHVYRIFPERFPGARVSDLNSKDIDWLLEDIDLLYILETPFDWSVIPKARKKGIKTVLMPMHECLPENMPYVPDDFHFVSKLEEELGFKGFSLPIPVNTERVKWRERTTARVFIHNAGHGGLNGRNGTAELIEALKYTKSDFKLIIRSQSHDLEVSDPRVEVRFMNAENYWDLWKEGDVFIFPERFNGLSLPLQEALASGMLVMSTDRYPMNTWLPKDPLIPVKEYRTEMISRRVNAAVVDPQDIAKTIDAWVDRDIRAYSHLGRKWAEENSWQKLKPKYDSCLRT